MRTVMLAALLSSAISTAASAQTTLGDYAKMYGSAPAPQPTAEATPAQRAPVATAEPPALTQRPPMPTGFERVMGPGQEWHCFAKPRLYAPGIYGAECGNMESVNGQWVPSTSAQFPYKKVWLNPNGVGYLKVQPVVRQVATSARDIPVASFNSRPNPRCDTTPKDVDYALVQPTAAGGVEACSRAAPPPKEVMDLLKRQQTMGFVAVLGDIGAKVLCATSKTCAGLGYGDTYAVRGPFIAGGSRGGETRYGW
jgi:hypothetical protein